MSWGARGKSKFSPGRGCLPTLLSMHILPQWVMAMLIKDLV